MPYLLVCQKGPNTCGDQAQLKGWDRNHGNTLSGRAVPQLQQPKATGGLRWAGADTPGVFTWSLTEQGVPRPAIGSCNDDDTARGCGCDTSQPRR